MSKEEGILTKTSGLIQTSTDDDVNSGSMTVAIIATDTQETFETITVADE